MSVSSNLARPPSSSQHESALEQGIDWRQCREIMRMKLAQDLRSSTLESGKRSRPLVGLIVSMTWLGIAFCLSRGHSADMATFVLLLFIAVTAIVIFGIIPNTQAAYEQNQEIISSKPVSDRTLLAAQLLGRLVIVLIITALFSLAPLAVLKLSFGISWPLVAGIYLSLVASSFSLLTLWLSLMFLAAGRLGLDRVRAFLRAMLMISALALIAPVLLLYLDISSVTRMTLSLAQRPLIALLPPSWFATLFLPVPHPFPLFQRAAALAVVCLAALVSSLRRTSSSYSRFIERVSAVEQRVQRSPLALKALAVISRIPVAGPLIVSDQSLGVASLVLISVQREDGSRSRTMLPRLLVLGFCIVYVFTRSPFPLVFAFLYVLSTISAGIKASGMSSSPGASWMLLAAPLDGLKILRGCRTAVACEYCAVPALLLMICLWLQYGPGLAIGVSISLLLETVLLVSATFIFNSRLPLSEGFSTASGLGSFVVASIGSAVCSAVAGVLYVLFDGMGLIGGAGAAVFIASMAALCYFVERIAGDRIGELGSSY